MRSLRESPRVPRSRRFALGAVMMMSLTTWTACHSAGPYGHSVEYAPLSDEGDAADEAREYDPVMASRFPEEWQAAQVSVFGIVEQRTPGSEGTADLALSVRSLSPRNLCNEGGEDTCRVTVSEREHGRVHALVKLATNDDVGSDAVGPGSLVRVIGKLDEEVHADGQSVLRGTYYRHWPRHQFVTTEARSYMLR